jgi:hypothetical protein
VAQLDNVIADLLAIEGANGAAIVDIDSGMALAAGGAPGSTSTSPPPGTRTWCARSCAPSRTSS